MYLIEPTKSIRIMEGDVIEGEPSLLGYCLPGKHRMWVTEARRDSLVRNSACLVVADGEPGAPPSWDMNVSPEKYLQRWPDGPRADDARRALADTTEEALEADLADDE